jgi:lipid II:glycine glycyltransferase (peptidoglycan interpeptide bridge formation enzyme)
MNITFEAISDKAQSLIREVAILHPINPFYTAQYMACRNALGFTPWIFVYKNNVQSNIYCPAFMKTGRLRRSLEIPSMPDISTDEPFWPELINFCRQQGVSDLSVHSFCSQGGEIPKLNSEKNREARWEYVLQLKHSDLFTKMRKGHAYRIKRAKKTGVEIRRTSDQEALKAHARLIGASMQRRQDRGEKVTTSTSANDLLQLIESGAGEIFQAVLADQIVSSNLILIAEKSGYSHSQGTNQEGMKCGAAHFLIHGIACILRQAGKEVHNLGGTNDLNPESGLVRFKNGFGVGTERIELETAQSKPGNVAYSKLRRFFNSVK